MAVETTSGNVQERGSKTATAFGFELDPNTGVYSPAADEVAVSAGGTEHMRVGGNWRARKIAKVALAAAAGGGGVLAWANPEGATIIITRVMLHLTTGVAAQTADVGVAANGTTSADNLLDGVSIATNNSILDNVEDQGTNGTSRQLMTSTQFITATASGTPTGLVGNAYIEYIIP